MAASFQSRIDRLNHIVRALQVPLAARQGLSAGELLERLRDDYGDGNPEARRRAIQRDLKALYDDGRVRKVGASRKDSRYLAQEEADEVDLSILGYALRQVEAQMQGQLSSLQLEAVLKRLRADCGDAVLGENKLRIIPDTLRLQPAGIDPTVLTRVLDALARDCALDVDYRGRDDKRSQPRLHPQAMLQRGPRVYLFALKGDEEGVRMYALHRMLSAEVTGEPARQAPQFDLDDALSNGQADFAGGNRVVLKALVRGYVETLLYECPLTPDQLLETVDEAGFGARLTAELPATGQLLRWLLGCGDNILVLEPEDLRAVMASQAAKMAGLYLPIDGTAGPVVG